MRSFLILALLLSASTLAQFQLAVSPSRVELLLLPGESWSRELTLVNRGTREERLSAFLYPFFLDTAGQLRPAGAEGLCPHLRVVPTVLTLAPGEEARVRLEGTAPQGQGTLWCAVFFGAQPRPLGLQGVQVAAAPQVGVVVYLTLRGTEAPALRVTALGGTGPRLAMELENPGNVLQRLSGEVLVLDLMGQERARLPVPELPLLPQGARRLELEAPASLPPGRYRVLLLLESAYGRYAGEGVWDVP